MPAVCDLHAELRGAHYMHSGSHFAATRILSNMRLFIVFSAGTALEHPPVSVVVDSKGNLYYSDLSQVFRVGPDGGWSPCGGVFASDGSLWLLESTVTNALRLRKAGAPRSSRR